MGGRANKLFIGGFGLGGQIAMQAAFYSEQTIGGVFTADADIPAHIIEDIQDENAEALIPQFEAKKNMFICVTSYKTMTDEQKEKIGEQGQLMRSHGFLRLTSIPLKKAIERMIVETHEYGVVNSKADVDKFNHLWNARNGNYDDVTVDAETLIQGF